MLIHCVAPSLPLLRSKRARIQEFSDPAVVIATGFPDLLLRGDRPEPPFILGMPIRRNQLAAMLSQALFFKGFADELSE